MFKHFKSNEKAKKQPQLHNALRIFLFSITISIILIYSLMLENYFVRGIHLSMQMEMRILAINYEDRLKSSAKASLPNAPFLNSYWDWKNAPKLFREKFPRNKHEVDKLSVWFSNSNADQEDEGLFFLLPYQMTNGSILYMTRRLANKSFNKIDLQQFNQSVLHERVLWALSTLLVIVIIGHFFYVG